MIMARKTPFGISALSKSNHEHAYLNEVMCNKDIGEMALRTNDGDTVSYNYFSRLTTSINTLNHISTFYGIDGMIYSINPTDTSFPMVISDTDTFTFECDKSAKKLIFMVDADAVVVEENQISEDIIDDLRVSFNIGDISIDTLIQNLSSEVIELPEQVDSFTVTDFQLYVENPISDNIIYINNILCLIES